MAKTYKDLISEVREMVQDTDTSVAVRQQDGFYINLLNRGLTAIGMVRPDAFYDLYDKASLNVPEVTDSATPATGQTAWTDNFGLEMQFYNALLNYIVAVAEITDDEYTVDGRAAMLMGEFKQTLVSI